MRAHFLCSYIFSPNVIIFTFSWYLSLIFGSAWFFFGSLAATFLSFFYFLFIPSSRIKRTCPNEIPWKEMTEISNIPSPRIEIQNPLNIKVENLFFLTFSCLVVVVTFLFGYITEYGILNGFTCSATKDVEKLWLALRWEKSIVTLYVTTQNKYTWEKLV